ncbi:MAG: VCBS repeat-containing protein [Ignavibacteriaceae bacterium]
MKLSQEERIGLKTGLSKSLLLVILFSDIIIPQIPFKGFCKLTSFEVDSGYTTLLSFNYDQDEYSDLLVYNPLGTKAKIYRGESGLNFNFSKEISFPLQPSRIEPVIGPNKVIESYAFTSRKSRSFGLYKFSNEGNPELINHIKFNYYPEYISIADINDDGKPEFLLSGNAFEGLSIINQKGNKLEEHKISEGQTFLNAQFIDVNDDQVKDIVALNSIDNTLHFLYNNSRTEFTELRKIDVGENVSALHIFDLNYDSYPDIIIGTTSSIKIYFGDPINPYQKIVSIQTPFACKDFAIGDFNRDGYFDFNCLSTSGGEVFTIFAKDFYSFYKGTINTKKSGIVEVIPFFSKFVYGSAFINKTGEVSILSKVTSMSDDQTFAIGVAPNAVSKFDLTDNGIIDLMFIDDFDQSLKFIIRDAAGLPEKYFSVNLNDDHKKIIQFNNSKLIKTFYCFSLNKRIIESVEVNFEKFSFKHDFFYADGPIKDLMLCPDEAGNAEIFILYSKDNSLNFEIYSKTTLKYSNRIYAKISYNWISPSIISAKKVLIGFWSVDNGFWNFNIANLAGSKYEINKINRIKRGDVSIISESNVSVNDQEVNYLSLISGKDGIFLLDGKDNYKIYSKISDKYDLRITNKNQLFFDKTNSIFVNDKKGKTLYRFSPVKVKNQIKIEKIFENIDISNFIVANLGQRKHHLIYTDNNYIIIKQLP